jgi:hypothetical protein
MSESPRPRSGKIPAAIRYSGIGRSSLYELASEHEKLFVKFGRSTLVNFDELDRILSELPAAQLKQARMKEKAAP